MSAAAGPLQGRIALAVDTRAELDALEAQLLDIQHLVLAAGDTRSTTAFYRDVWQQGLVDHEQSLVEEMKKMADKHRALASS